MTRRLNVGNVGKIQGVAVSNQAGAKGCFDNNQKKEKKKLPVRIKNSSMDKPSGERFQSQNLDPRHRR